MDLRKTIVSINSLLLILFISNCSKEEKLDSNQFSADFSDSTLVALVNGDPIRYNDVDNAIKQFLYHLGRDTVQFKSQIADTALWNEALNFIISTRLLVQEAYEQNIHVTNSEIDRAINQIKGRFPSEQRFFNALQEAGLTIEKFTNNLTKDIMVQKLLERQVSNHIGDVSDEEALNYYNEYGDKFMQDEQIRVHHILLKVTEAADAEKVKTVESKALSILEKIKNGEDFESLARQYSEDPSALKGGDIGFFSRGDMIRNFEDAAFVLKINEVSDLVRTPLGFHIIRLDERKGTQKIPFEDVKVEIKFRLKQERSNKFFEKYVADLKSKANLKIKGQG